jgi:hypothetical protein
MAKTLRVPFTIAIADSAARQKYCGEFCLNALLKRSRAAFRSVWCRVMNIAVPESRPKMPAFTYEKDIVQTRMSSTNRQALRSPS